MHGDPFSDAYSDGCEFFFSSPDAGEAFFCAGVYSVVLAGEDECALDGVNECMEVFSEVSEVNDGVADELAWAVVGGLSTSVDF